MNKKVLCLVCVLMLVLTSATAFAAASKTTHDTTTVTTEEPTITVVPVAATEKVNAVIAELDSFLQGGSKAVEFFPADVQSQITSLLPAGTDSAKFVINELVPFNAYNYADITSPVTVAFTFATQYKDNQPIVAMLGLIDENGNTIWLPLKASVVNGQVMVVFTPEALAALNGKEPFVAILSEEE